MRVELAHITDVHLPTPFVHPHELLGKRVLGWLSWRLRRRRAHRPQALRELMADVERFREETRAPLLITGDLVNIATRGEFVAARCWLRKAGIPETVMFVPGNHDFYVRGAVKAGLAWLTPWMTGARGTEEAEGLPPFPLVRHVRNVALIGLNSAYPAPWREASGRLDEEQLNRLENVLRDCAAKGFCRVVLIHHPPLEELGADKPRKALKNAVALEKILTRAGAELVLFGHTHQWAHVKRELPGGRMMHVLSAPSASMTTGRGTPPAGWQRISIARQRGQWHIRVERRELSEQGGMRVRETLSLSSLARDI